jgi:pyridoxamine 5'-phosphate oxidase
MRQAARVDLDLAALRRDYARAGLSEADLAPTWHEQLRRWLAEAAVLAEPGAAVLGTVAADGTPSARTVLCKGVDERGLVVFTNLTSRKATEALTTGVASLVFPWVELERQVCVVGTVEPVPREEVEAYFATRPRGSQLGAWASRQSAVVPSRAHLEQRYREVEQRYDGVVVPVPPFWGGLRVLPSSVELWQGRPSRLHDRLRYRRDGQDWVVERLAP